MFLTTYRNKLTHGPYNNWSAHNFLTCRSFPINTANIKELNFITRSSLPLLFVHYSWYLQTCSYGNIGKISRRTHLWALFSWKLPWPTLVTKQTAAGQTFDITKQLLLTLGYVIPKIETSWARSTSDSLLGSLYSNTVNKTCPLTYMTVLPHFSWKTCILAKPNTSSR